MAHSASGRGKGRLYATAPRAAVKANGGDIAHGTAKVKSARHKPKAKPQNKTAEQAVMQSSRAQMIFIVIIIDLSLVALITGK